jgi:6-phosphofructokinase 1
MVGFNFANMAMDLIIENQMGQMVALREGKYTNIPITTLSQGIKRVDVDELYDVEAYRPKVRHVHQKPMFLY